MKWQVKDPEVEIEHEPKAFGGTGAISLKFGGVTMRWTLEDAETIGEKLVECVRNAEAATKIQRR